MANFTKAFNETIPNNEGKYSNDRNDSGGETIYGLTRKDDSDWQGWKTIDSYKRKKDYPACLPYPLLLEMAQPYYKKKYWDFAQMDKFSNQNLAKKIFSIAVNMGKGIAIQFLQRGLNALNHNGKDYANLAVDGVFGQNTLNALNKCTNLENLYEIVKSLQGARYVQLVEFNSKLKDFSHGWFNRIRDEG